MPSRTLKVNIVGDSKSLERAFTRSGVAAQGFGASVDRAAVGTRNLGNLFAGGIAAGASISALKALTTSASDMNEEVSKSRVVFGSSAKSIDDWSKTTAKAFGISRTEALRAAGTFGALFSGAGGKTAADAAKLSKVVVNLAGDLASFNNTSTDDALQALRSGLSGEIEPLRRFQVFLTEASVAQTAMTQTGKTSAKQLTQGEKILARYALILDQTKRAQGDAARTSGEFAGQQRILKAQSADLAGNIGKILLPAATELATELNRGAGFALDLTGALGKLATAKIPTIHIPFVFDIQPGSALGTADQFRDTFGPGGPEKLARFLGGKFKTGLNSVTELINRELLRGSPIQLPTLASFLEKQQRDANKANKKPVEFTVATPDKVVVKFTASQRNTFFDNAITRALDRSQDGSLQDQLRKLDAVSDTLTKRLAVTKDITRKLNLEDQLVSIGRQKRSIQDQIAAELQQRLDDAKSSRLESQAKELQRVQARQFKALGLGADGGDVIPGVGNLKKQLDSLTQRLAGSSLNLSSKLQSQLAGVRKVLSGEFGKITKESRESVAGIYDAIRDEFDKGGKGPLTKAIGLNTKKVTAGIGLSTVQASEIRGRLSGVNSAGLSRAPVVVESHTTVQLDGHTVGKTVTRSQQKTRKRNPAQRRGPNRGGV